MFVRAASIPQTCLDAGCMVRPRLPSTVYFHWGWRDTGSGSSRAWAAAVCLQAGRPRCTALSAVSVGTDLRGGPGRKGGDAALMKSRACPGRGPWSASFSPRPACSLPPAFLGVIAKHISGLSQVEALF